jgi:hypothetical protein
MDSFFRKPFTLVYKYFIYFYAIYQNLKNNKKCKAATGLLLEQFDNLSLVFAKYLKKKNSQSLSWDTEAAPHRSEGSLIFYFAYRKRATRILQSCTGRNQVQIT